VPGIDTRAHQNNAFQVFQDRLRKYSPNNIANGGLVILEARCNDKYIRIKNGGADFADESLADVYYDMANDWLIEPMVVRGEWPKPTNANRISLICRSNDLPVVANNVPAF
jgi:hypothetical protein